MTELLATKAASPAGVSPQQRYRRVSKTLHTRCLEAIETRGKDLTAQETETLTRVSLGWDASKVHKPEVLMTDLERAMFEFLSRKYTQTADARQRDLGLQYTQAETHDLAHEMAEFAINIVAAAIRSRVSDADKDKARLKDMLRLCIAELRNLDARTVPMQAENLLKELL